MSENSERLFISILAGICKKHGIKMRAFNYDWIIELKKNAKTFYIAGYKFPNNNAAASLICDDKSSLFDILNAAGVPAVEHRYFMSPCDLHYIGADGNWDGLQAMLAEYGKLVLKPNSASGGEGCYAAESQSELERIAQELFSRYGTIAASPYIDIDNEFRVIALNGRVELIYSKNRLFVAGDGVGNAAALMRAKYGSAVAETSAGFDFSAVPAKGEKIYLTWKHNLANGARAEIVTDPALGEELSRLALEAAGVVGIEFASVDIVSSGGKLRVLEINSGVMTEEFAALDGNCFKIAETIYEKALTSLFGEDY